MLDLLQPSVLLEQVLGDVHFEEQLLGVEFLALERHTAKVEFLASEGLVLVLAELHRKGVKLALVIFLSLGRVFEDERRVEELGLELVVVVEAGVDSKGDRELGHQDLLES